MVGRRPAVVVVVGLVVTRVQLACRSGAIICAVMAGHSQGSISRPTDYKWNVARCQCIQRRQNQLQQPQQLMQPRQRHRETEGGGETEGKMRRGGRRGRGGESDRQRRALGHRQSRRLFSVLSPPMTTGPSPLSPSLLSTYPLLPNFPSAHLLIYPSSHLAFSQSSHLPIFSSSHLLIY